MQVKIEPLPNKKLIGRFTLAGKKWQTRPADTVEEIMTAARKLAKEYDRIINERHSQRSIK